MKVCVAPGLNKFYSKVLRLFPAVVITVVISPANAEASFFLEASDLVKEMKENPALVVLDVRVKESYSIGHIRHAISLPVNKTFNRTGRIDKVGNLDYIQKLFSSAGIDQDTEVVIYDDGRYIDAGRMFWVLEVYGHNKVRVLNGGYKVWESLKLPKSKKNHIAKPKRFLATIQPQRISTKFNIRLASQGNNKTIIDSRSVEEYLGKKSITDRKGHIPSAINIPWDRGIGEDNKGLARIKTLAELKDVYGQIDKTRPVITYCNKGKQSSFSYLVLREMGYQASHYDGSWYEWSNDVNLPVVKK